VRKTEDTQVDSSRKP